MPVPYRWLVVAITTAGVMLASPAIGASRPYGPSVPAGCHRVYWMGEGVRFARHVYQDTPTRWELAHLARMDRCQRNQHAARYLAGVIRQQRKAWKARHAYVASHPWTTSTVSWYQDGGQTASGFHSTYGVADCGSGGGPCYSFGTQITFCLNSCVTATVDDHGPYVAGRAFDLNQNTASAIGFSGVGSVRWRLG